MMRQISVRTHFQARSGAGRVTPATCTGCGKSFVPTRSWQKYHSENCRKRSWDRHIMFQHIRAAFNELVDKMERGL